MDGNTVYCQIALHETPIQTEDEEGGAYTEYEYDFNSFYCKDTDINIEDVRATPEEYLDYPFPIPTNDERISALEEALISMMEV